MEFLYRFHDILGLDEPLSFKELEQELMCPWLNCSDRLENKLNGSRDASFYGSGVSDHINDQMLLSTPEYDVAVHNEDLYASIPVSTGEMGEEVKAKLGPKNYVRFAGKALTRVHCSILKLVITELLSKFATFVDPNIDTGEHKSKRGKKRDADGLVFLRKKLSVLPVNEYTWPEVARRYILAVTSTDGNFDSVEVSSGESRKLFRCLQGDGGVYYGSLTGIAGMEADALVSYILAVLLSASVNWFWFQCDDLLNYLEKKIG